MKSIRDIGYVKDVKILVRVDFNVPIRNGKVIEDFRIRSAIPTLRYLLDKGAIVIMMSHLEVVGDENPSLEPVARRLNDIGIKTEFVKDYARLEKVIQDTKGSGSCYLLENLRSFAGEKSNDVKFSKGLASLVDIYVNEAFSVCHRTHASIVGVPRYIPSYAGFQLEKEVTNLSAAFSPIRPFLFILGGAKFSTKLPLLEKFIGSADDVFVGGALANDFFKEKGYEVGRSLVSENAVGLGQFLNNPKLILPMDIVVEDGQSKPADQLCTNEKILDAGPETVKELKEKIMSAKMILWNGPLGLYEDGYKGATLDLARIIGDRTRQSDEVVSIVGGGDTLAAISTLGIEDAFTFISTGGGAMLDFLADGTLPGIEALDEYSD